MKLINVLTTKLPINTVYAVYARGCAFGRVLLIGRTYRKPELFTKLRIQYSCVLGETTYNETTDTWDRYIVESDSLYELNQDEVSKYLTLNSL